MATKKQKFDAVVSLFGTLLELTVSFFAALKKRGISLAEAVVRLASDPKAQEEIITILARLAPSGVWATVTSDGRSASVMITALQAKGRRVGDWAKDIMSKSAFAVSRGVTYRLVIIRGDEFTDKERTTVNIFTEAERRRYRKPPAEVAALLREKFSQEGLGFSYVVVCHEPIRDSDGDPILFGLDRYDGGEWLAPFYAHPENRWGRGSAFLFLVPQEES